MKRGIGNDFMKFQARFVKSFLASRSSRAVIQPIGYSNRTERIYNWICYCHYKQIVISKLNETLFSEGADGKWILLMLMFKFQILQITIFIDTQQ